MLNIHIQSLQCACNSQWCVNTLQELFSPGLRALRTFTRGDKEVTAFSKDDWWWWGDQLGDENKQQSASGKRRQLRKYTGDFNVQAINNYFHSCKQAAQNYGTFPCSIKLIIPWVISSHRLSHGQSMVCQCIFIIFMCFSSWSFTLSLHHERYSDRQVHEKCWQTPWNKA